MSVCMLRNLLITILLFLSSNILLAEEDSEQRWYSVEIIIYEQPDDYRWDGERNTTIITSATLENMVELKPYKLTPTPLEIEDPAIVTIEGEQVLTEQPQTDAQIKEPTDVASTTVEATEENVEPFQWPEPFSIPDSDQFLLNEYARKIKESTQLKLLLHTAWQQPGLAKEEAVAVHVHDAIINEVMDQEPPTPMTEAEVNKEPEELNANPEPETAPSETVPGQSESESIQEANNDNQSSLPDEQQDSETQTQEDAEVVTLFDEVYQQQDNQTDSKDKQKRDSIDGSITVRLSRYLHMDIDLTYTIKEERPVQTHNDKTALKLSAATESPKLYSTLMAANITSGKPIKYRLVHSRKMRSKEIHYIDHPKIGIIALITPIEPPEPKTIGD